MQQLITTSILGILMSSTLLAQDTTTYFVPQDYSSIQAVMNNASKGDTILVAPGTYNENIIWPSGKNLHLKSLNGPTETIIDGGMMDRVIVMNALSTASTIDGFTIQNGHTEDELGAGIKATGTRANFKNLIIRDNIITGIDGTGAGLYLIDYSGLISSCQFSNNFINVTERAEGGGVYLRLNGDVIIESCNFDSNQCRGTSHAEGGGLSMYWHGINFTGSQTPVVSIKNSTISENLIIGNREDGGGLSINGFGPHYFIHVDSTIISNNKSIGANSFGGGVKIYSTVDVTMSDCIIDNNLAADGAGFYQSSVTDQSISHLNRCVVSNNFSTSSNTIHAAVEVYKKGTCTLTNCVVSNNSAYAVMSENLSGLSHLNIYNCTLANNKASMHIRKTNLEISNSIIWNDNGIPVDQHQFDNNNIMDFSFSVVKGGSAISGTKIITADPQFISNDDLRLAPGSPCINNGDPSIDNNTDLLGNPRPLPVGTKPDIGAYEMDQVTSTTDALTTLNDITVFPNPSTGLINISEQVNNLWLYSSTGELLVQRKNTDQLVTSNLANGVYVLHIQKGEKQKQVKVIVLN